MRQRFHFALAEFFYHICEDFRLQANKARPYYVRLLTLERGGNDKEKTRPFNLHADFSRVLSEIFLG